MFLPRTPPKVPTSKQTLSCLSASFIHTHIASAKSQALLDADGPAQIQQRLPHVGCVEREVPFTSIRVSRSMNRPLQPAHNLLACACSSGWFFRAHTCAAGDIVDCRSLVVSGCIHSLSLAVVFAALFTGIGKHSESWITGLHNISTGPAAQSRMGMSAI